MKDDEEAMFMDGLGGVHVGEAVFKQVVWKRFLNSDVRGCFYCPRLKCLKQEGEYFKGCVVEKN